MRTRPGAGGRHVAGDDGQDVVDLGAQLVHHRCRELEAGDGHASWTSGIPTRPVPTANSRAGPGRRGGPGGRPGVEDLRGELLCRGLVVSRRRRLVPHVTVRHDRDPVDRADVVQPDSVDGRPPVVTPGRRTAPNAASAAPEVSAIGTLARQASVRSWEGAAYSLRLKTTTRRIRMTSHWNEPSRRPWPKWRIAAFSLLALVGAASCIRVVRDHLRDNGGGDRTRPIRCWGRRDRGQHAEGSRQRGRRRRGITAHRFGLAWPGQSLRIGLSGARRDSPRVSAQRMLAPRPCSPRPLRRGRTVPSA